MSSTDDYRTITKSGGYKKVPLKIVKEQAEKLNLSESEIPRIVMSKSIRCADISYDSKGKVVIRLPRYEHKSTIPKSIRHELAHVKLDSLNRKVKATKNELGIYTYAKDELLTRQLEKSRKTGWSDLVDIVATFVLEDGIDKSYATDQVMRVAKDLDLSKSTIGRAREELKTIWKNRSIRGL